MITKNFNKITKYIKDIFYLLIDKLNSYGKITISGEVNLMCSEFTKTLFNDDAFHCIIYDYATDLRGKHPILHFEINKGVHETSIKIFAYNKKIFMDKYLELLKEDIFLFVEEFFEKDSLKVRVSMKGNYQDLEFNNDFIITNNGKNLYYKITKKTPSSFILRRTRYFTKKLLNV